MGQINKYAVLSGRDALKMPENESTHADMRIERQIKVPLRENVEQFLEDIDKG